MNRRYLIGETIKLRTQTRHPRTNAPVNVDSVTLDSFTLNNVPITLLERDFTNTAVGVYELSIPTEDLDPGVYYCRIKIEGDLGTSIQQDTFVIADPALGVPSALDTNAEARAMAYASSLYSDHLLGYSHLRHRGLWQPGVTYSEDDQVLSLGVLWRCTEEHLSSGDHIDITKFVMMSGPTPWTVGSVRYVGHSYVDVGDLSEDGAGRGYFPGRLMTALGLHPGQVETVAVSGSTARWHSYFTLQGYNPGPVRGYPLQPEVGLGVVWYGGNDAIQGYTPDTWLEWTYKEGYRSIITRLRAGAVFENNMLNKISYEGTWTEVEYADLGKVNFGSGTGFHKSTEVGAKITFITPNDMGLHSGGAWVHLGFIGGASGAAASVKIDGELHGHLDVGRGPEIGTRFGSSDTSPSNYVYRMWVPTTPTDENHYYVAPRTIEVEITGGVVGQGLMFDYVGIESDDGPCVLCLSTISPSNPRSIWSVLGETEAIATYNQWLHEVIESFTLPESDIQDPTVRYVDVNYPIGGYPDVWDRFTNEKYFSSDGLHPNKLGGQLITTAILSEIDNAVHSGMPPETLLGKSKFERDPIWDTPRWFVSDVGKPLTTLDSFNRDYSEDDLDNSDALVQSGTWGLDGEGKAMLVKSGSTVLEDYRDSFDRADDSSNLGDLEYDRITNTPPSWQVGHGTWGIASNKATLVADAGTGSPYPVAFFETGSTQHWIEANVTSVTGNIDQGLIVRYADINNYIIFTYNLFGVGLLYEVIGGVLTLAASGSAQSRPRVEVTEDHVVRVYPPNESTPTITYTIPDDGPHAPLRTATKVGLWGNNSVGITFDNLHAGVNVINPVAHDWRDNTVVYEVGDADGVTGIIVGDDNAGVPTGMGFCWRVEDADNYMRAWYDASFFLAWAVEKIVNGSIAESWIFWANASSGDEIAVQHVGDAIAFYKNGEPVYDVENLAYLNHEETPSLTGTKIGLYQTTTSTPRSRWRDLRWGKTFTEVSPNRAAMFVDHSNPSKVTIYGPFDRRDEQYWGDGITLTPDIHALSTVTIDAATVVGSRIEVVFADTSTAGFSVTLPDAADMEGRSIYVRKISSDGNTLTVDSQGGQVEGAGSSAWTTSTSRRFVSDGNDWWVI